MAREATFTFIPETLLNRKSSDPEFRVSITRTGMLYFPREVIDVYDLKSKHFKFYADLEKKAIAWTYFDQGQLPDMKKLKKLFMLPSKAGQISIKKLLSSLGFKELRGSISNVPVKRYKDQGLLGDDFHYIVIRAEDMVERRHKKH